MRIAVNTRFAHYGYEEGYGRFTREVARRLAGLDAEDRLLFLNDRPVSEPLHKGPNVETVTLGPPARHPLLWRCWYDWRVPARLRSFGADVFFSPDGICSLRTSVPQVVAIHDLSFLHFPGHMPRAQRAYYMEKTPEFIRKAARVITVSAFSRDDIHRHYPFSQGKVEVVHNATGGLFRPMSWEDRQQWKESHTGGREFFVTVGSIHPRKNLVNLLKAFSLFKRRHRTNMMLLIAGRLAWQHEDFQKALSAFRFRDDVRLTGYLSAAELASTVGSAYALVYPSLWEGFGIPVLEAMRSGVPVLCSGNSAMPEVAGEAGLFFDPLQPEDIAQQMSRIFRDEAERDSLVRRGLSRADAFTWESSAGRVRRVLAEAAAGNAYL
jgi:glycosyltransferase involved in cell wall biosynthesis